MTTLRRLRPFILPKSKERKNPGPAPQPLLLKLTQLRINDDYQRQLSRDSTRMGVKIASEFDWELYHLPVVSPTGDTDEVTGLPIYEVLDGQHTAIAAVTNGHIRELWCWPGRPDENLASRAESFEKLNTQRTAITPVELFWASVSANKEEALEVVAACRNTGASVIKRPKPYGDMHVGETICVDPLMKLARKGGKIYVERILRICMNLRLSPISKIWILTLEDLLFKPHSLNHMKGTPATLDLQIENAINQIGQENLLRQAKIINAGSSARDRQTEYWLVASFIKKEIEKSC